MRRRHAAAGPDASTDAESAADRRGAASIDCRCRVTGAHSAVTPTDYGVGALLDGSDEDVVRDQSALVLRARDEQPAASFVSDSADDKGTEDDA